MRYLKCGKDHFGCALENRQQVGTTGSTEEPFATVCAADDSSSHVSGLLRMESWNFKSIARVNC